MKPSNRGLILRLSISLGAIALIVYSLRGKLSEAFEILQHDVAWHWFLLAGFAYFVTLLLITKRLQVFLHVQGVMLDFKNTFYLSFIGLFFNLFFPSAVGGDIAKAYYAAKHSGKKIECVTSVVLDRLMGFVALISMAAVALLMNEDIKDPRLNKVIYIFLGVMIFMVGFFASRRFAKVFGFLKQLIPSQKIKDKISSLYHSIYSFKGRPGALVAAIVYSLLGQSCFIMMHYFAAVSLNVELNVLLFFVLVPVFCIVAMAPSLGGLGVREAGMIYFFSKFMPGERALAISILLDILIYGFSLIAGVVYSLRGGLKEMQSMDIEKLKSTSE